MKGFRAITGLSLLLAACATTPPEIATMPRAEHFDLRGRISVRSEKGSDSATIRWQRSASEERIQVFTPLGSQLAELLKPVDGEATLTQSNGEPMQQAESISRLSKTLFGLAIDTAELARWVQGEGLHEAEPQNMSTSDGATWQVTAEKFQVFQQHRVATRLTASSASTTLKLVVDEWTPLP